MTTHTASVDKHALGSHKPWFSPLAPEDRESSQDDANPERPDWVHAAQQAETTFVYVRAESNVCPQIEGDWASLATAARNRWLRENPF